MSRLRPRQQRRGEGPGAETRTRRRLGRRVGSAAPLPQPMLAHSGPIPTRGDWSFEVKWDGLRAICG
jgi:ATP-dependent DNA ligase